MKRNLLLILLPTLVFAIYDMRWYEPNNWLCPFYNEGRFGLDVTVGSGMAGGFWPQPLHNAYIFGAGPWVGAVSGGDSLVTMGYNPNSGGTEMMPTLCRYWRQGAGNPRDKIYRYPVEWPPPRNRFPMAPLTPRSETELWCCFGDSAPMNHIVVRPACDVAAVGSYAYVVGVVDTFINGPLGTLDIIDVSNPQNPDAIGRHFTQNRARGVAVAGGYAYVAEDSGFCVIDVSNPQNPYETGRCGIPGFAHGVAVVGSYAYVAVDGLLIIDVADPQNPYEIGRCFTPGSANGVAVVGSYAYVADGSSGLRIIDVSDPQNPHETGSYVTPSIAYDVAVTGGCAYVASHNSGLRIIDVSDPQNPDEMGFYDTPGSARGVAVVGSYACVADYDHGLRIIDVSNPRNPDEIGSCNTHGRARGVAVVGSHAYVADAWSCLRVVDISDPQNPHEVGYCTPGVGPLGIDVGLTVFGFSDSVARDLFILRYDLVNASGSPLDRSYFGMVLDGDVGDASDDMTGLILDKLFHVGADTFRITNTGYIYDYNNVENPGATWESGTPGAVAIRLLQAPGDLGLTAFKRFDLDVNPVADRDQYLTMAGYNYHTGVHEPYDSVDVAPADKRVLMSSGPFDLPAESTATFYYAVIGAPYGDSGEVGPKHDTTELALRCWWAERIWRERLIGIEEEYPTPGEQRLTLSGTPNPFRTHTAISLQLAADSPAALAIFDAGGRRVRTLTVNRASCAVWDGKDDLGQPLPSGAYFARLTAADQHATARLVLQR